MHQQLEIPIIEITRVDPANGRLALDEGRARRLALQIAQQGLLNPITVREHNGMYELIAGNHRLRAFEILGRCAIPAVIVHADDQAAATLRLAENVNRSNLSAVEEAIQLTALVNNHAQGVDGVAAELNRKPEWILDRLDIASWPPRLQEHVHTRRISVAAAKTLVRITPPELRDQRISDAALHGCSARTASLWLQTCHRDDPIESATSDFSAQIPATRYETKTNCNCFLCSSMVSLNDTHSVRLCTSCMNFVLNQQRQAPEQSPMHTPPLYDPPVPTR